MKYLGGKQKLGKHIANRIKELFPGDSVEGYMEPFCGALGVLVHMTDDYKCYASDVHPDLIKLWKSVKDNSFVSPMTVSEEEYNQAKLLKSPSALKAFIGFGLSFGYLLEFQWQTRKRCSRLYGSIDDFQRQCQVPHTWSNYCDVF